VNFVDRKFKMFTALSNPENLNQALNLARGSFNQERPFIDSMRGLFRSIYFLGDEDDFG